MLTNKQLTGRDDSLLQALPSILTTTDSPIFAHPQAATALLELQSQAEKDQQPFQVISGYRSFQQQAAIWNRKYRGDLPVLDANEQVIDITQLPAIQLIRAIMLFSALPGASRHHWGSDFDIFPTAPIQQGYQVKLLASEFDEKGIAEDFNQWLSEALNHSDFFRPYANFQQGIAAEPWHISYAPLANEALSLLSIDIIEESLKAEKIVEAQTVICRHLPELYQQFINNICKPRS